MPGDERESVARLRLTCQEGIVTRELAEREDELENALLGARVPWDGEELPLRSAQARLAVETDYAPPRRARPRRCSPSRPRSTTSGACSSQPATSSRSTSPGSPTPSRATRTRRACGSGPSSTRSTPRASRARRRSPRRASTGSTACSGRSVRRPPATLTPAWIRRLSPLEATYTKERSVPVCVATLARLGFDLDAERGDPHRPRRPSAEVSAGMCHRRRPAARRPPHHPRAGRAPRLRGVPPRGRSRAPLRRLRPGAAARRSGGSPATTRSPRSTRSCSTRSRSSRAGTRSTSASPTARPGERRCCAVLQHAALPPLLGEARLRARLLVSLFVRRRDARGV